MAKTTIELPDELVRDLKVKAVRENRKLKDLVTDLLRQSLYAESKPKSEKLFQRAPFPIFSGGHPAAEGKELTPERLHEILLEDEVKNLIR